MPDLDMFLPEAEREPALQLLVPVCTIDAAHSDIDRLLAETGSFAASLVDGMLVHRMRLNAQTGLRLLAPGEIIVRQSSFCSGAPESYGYTVVGEARVILFDDHLLLGARRCPRLLAALLLHVGQQAERATSQMMICQLPRVEDRVLAMMWFLADTWGRVTPAGTFLALRLTHQALGELVGARRPTVTLALKHLTDRDALRRQQRGWLLLERPSWEVKELPQARTTEQPTPQAVTPEGPTRAGTLGDRRKPATPRHGRSSAFLLEPSGDARQSL